MAISRQVGHPILVSLLIWILATDRPGLSDPIAPNIPIYSEAFCLKIFEETVEKARSSTWQISDRNRHILTQCRTKFPTAVDPSIPLPHATQCLEVVKTLVREGTKKLKEIELPEEQVRSLSRCDEVLKYYDWLSDAMLPTLNQHDRLVVDKTSYQTQAPQRGDIIAFNSPTTTQSVNTPAPLTTRIIGVPGETVKIADGKVYINDRQLREDYIAAPVKYRYDATVVPANNYFVLSDNRKYLENSQSNGLVAREAIVGKVIWHFGSK